MSRLRTSSACRRLHGLFEVGAAAEDTDLVGHDLLHLDLERVGALGAAAVQERVEPGSLGSHGPSRISAVGMSRSPFGLSTKSAMNSPTINAATTVSATEGCHRGG